MNKIMNNVFCGTTGMTMGTEFKLASFYEDITRLGVQWVTLDKKYEVLLQNMCDSAYTEFAIELRSVAAAFAVISTDPHMYRNPFTKFLVYRRGLSWKWIKIMLEFYINEGKYIWERNSRKEYVCKFLDERVATHPVLNGIENRIDTIVINHYLGPEMVDMAIDGYAEIKRNDWQNKIERVTGEVISMW